jgi:D-alanyl-lipoteichoic acid acyltransferase DltB (MBOAT superfamily)
MSFSSVEFLFFFPVVTAIYFALPYRWRWAHLLAASCVFYMAFVPAYILILAFTILVDYFAGIALERAHGHRRKLWLLASLIANLGILAFFKYYNFAASNMNGLLRLAGVSGHVPLLSIVLPIGLSFHTFQAMSYTIEVYRGNQSAERHFGIYALYVMFYPQLVAGPIERPQNLLPQLRTERPFDYERAASGLRQMAWGFFKKTVVADRLVVGVDAVYSRPQGFGGMQLVLATVMFAVQIYADFSAYSDIALGSARVMGIELMKNFDRPYGARNLAEFWRRWHISLYSWFNDYVYGTFVVSHRDWGRWAVVCGVILTFTLSGLWHGAAWTFVVWGVLHGVGVAAETLTRRFRARTMSSAAWRWVGMFGTFGYVCFAYIFFRAKTLADAEFIVTHLTAGWLGFLQMMRRPGVLAEALGSMGYFREELVLVTVASAFMFAAEALDARRSFVATTRRHPVVRWLSYYALVGVIVFFGAHNATQPFIYFQF